MMTAACRETSVAYGADEAVGVAGRCDKLDTKATHIPADRTEQNGPNLWAPLSGRTLYRDVIYGSPGAKDSVCGKSFGN